MTSLTSSLSDQDLIVHVRDINHPETVNQKVNVLNVLKNLQIPEKLMSSIIEVHNKIDLMEGSETVFYHFTSSLSYTRSLICSSELYSVCELLL